VSISENDDASVMEGETGGPSPDRSNRAFDKSPNSPVSALKPSYNSFESRQASNNPPRDGLCPAFPRSGARVSSMLALRLFTPMDSRVEFELL